MKLQLAASAAATLGLASASWLDLGAMLEGRLGPLWGSETPLVEEPQTAASTPQTGANELLSKLNGIVGNALGPVPDGAAEAWQEVLDTVPNASQKLADAVKIAAQKRGVAFANADKRPAIPFFPGKSHKTEPVDMSKWQFHVQDEALPDHSLRIKSPKDLGVDKTKQYSGYLDVEDEDKHFFFWFFESRNDPKNDPVVLWLNGGPGCSSLTGLFFELGPASIDENLQPVHNKYSWNSNANVIFLDQPVNVGYSYSSGQVSDTVTAGKDFFAFLQLFFKQFPEYAERDFHIAGESYAGHYIPAFAAEILGQADRRFNLTSVLIGNGLTNPLIQDDAYEPMACGEGGYPAVLEEEECQKMLDSQPRCEQLNQACADSESVWACVPATIYCNNVNMGPYQKTGLNVYDIREPCDTEKTPLCYPQLDVIEQYLNLDDVKEAVGADVDKYVGCNMNVNGQFLFRGDHSKPFQQDVSLLLDVGVPVLIYAGDKDFICNWVGNEAWSHSLPWHGHDEFASAKTRKWQLKSGGKGGEVRNHDIFTFLRVYDAGHMVPFNQPEAALEMVNRWISGDFKFQ